MPFVASQAVYKELDVGARTFSSNAPRVHVASVLPGH